jgi:hypothetical protein
VFGNAIPAFGYISPLCCEDAGSIGAKGKIVLLFYYIMALKKLILKN